MIWRAVVIDVVLCVLMLTLSVMSDEPVSYTHLTLPTKA